MAFSFGSPAAAASNSGNVQTGPDLEDIQQETLGFLALAGESKVQLLPAAWPQDQLPPPTSCLMSVASQKGLIAAAAPDAIVVASTESVRKAFEGAAAGDGNVKPFQPQLKLPMPMRVSQLAFTADESYLVLSAESGGGLAVYEVSALMNGATESTFQLSTNGQSLRALVPNPTPEKGELLALVTTDGNLMMANLKDMTFTNGTDGQILKSGVSCLSWSTKGKQLVAGLANGAAFQMTPEGEGKAEIPRPPTVDTGHHVSSITWLENHVFLMVHTPSAFDNSQAPQSSFHIVTRSGPAAQSVFTYQKIADPAAPFGLNRSPPHHFMLRLKDFPPNLQDVIVVASSASTDIGLFSRSKTALTNTKPANKVTGVFTMTEMTDDSRRAQLPMTADLNDTSPIGLALDLSSNSRVSKPIPTDEEIAETPSPVPALMVLNNEGVLMAWWVIYAESIRQGTPYPGLVAMGGIAQPVAPTNAFGSAASSAFGTGISALPAPSSAPAFGAPSLSGNTTSAFGAPSGLGKSQSAWGIPAANTGPSFGSSTFGSATATAAPKFGSSTFGSAATTTATPASSSPAFGSCSFGSTSATTTTTPAFGAPAFGATSTPAFGLGSRPSPWANGGSTAPSAAFGQSGGTNTNKTSGVFGASTSGTGSNTTAPTGFAAFASKGGFAAAGTSPSSGGSVFGSKASTGAFGSPATTSVFGGGKIQETPSSTFGQPLAASLSPFVLGSTFKADPTAKDDISLSSDSRGSFFGGGFSNALGETAHSMPQAPVSPEADMGAVETPRQAESILENKSTTPSTPAAPRSSVFGTPGTTSGGLFGSKLDSSTGGLFGLKPFAGTPASGTTGGGLFGTKPATSTPGATPGPTGFSFGQQPPTSNLKPGSFSFANLGSSTSPGPKTPTGPPLFSLSKTPPSPQVKPEPGSGSPGLDQVPEAPLPPNSTSKTAFGIGESSGSSVATEAPLPPDFVIKPVPKSEPAQDTSASAGPKSIPANLISPSNVLGGADDAADDDSDFVTDNEESDGAEDASEEGSGEDITKDLSPTSDTNHTLGSTPQSSFGGLQSHSPDNTFTKISKPGQAMQQRSLFGEIQNKAPLLPPPKNTTSPRSPSPIRNAVPGRMLRPDRVSSAPGMASQILGSRPSTGNVPASGHDTFALSKEEHNAEEKRRAESRARQEAEETRMLEDKDDDDLQKFLASDAEGTKKLEAFQSRAEYLGVKPMDNIAAQVETVYRDINSMIDTLGLNARALKCFMKGHNEQRKEEGRTIEDLNQDEEWCLVEIEELSSVVEKDLAEALEEGRMKDVTRKLDECTNLQKDFTRLRTRFDDIKKSMDSFRDPALLAVSRAQPLSAEQTAQQHDLRKEYTAFQKLLSEAEESLALLRVKSASQSSHDGRFPGSAVPTVEAVMKTITKMTTMAEKRSGDVDVLADRMRKINFNPGSSVNSREGSPFSTPMNNRSTMRIPGSSSTYGLFYTPESVRDGPSRFQSSIMSSASTMSRGSPRKKLSGYTPTEKLQLRAKAGRKKEVMEKLKGALQRAGTNVRPMDDTE